MNIQWSLYCHQRILQPLMDSQEIIILLEVYSISSGRKSHSAFFHLWFCHWVDFTIAYLKDVRNAAA
jgi:hypothetical protein